MSESGLGSSESGNSMSAMIGILPADWAELLGAASSLFVNPSAIRAKIRAMTGFSQEKLSRALLTIVLFSPNAQKIIARANLKLGDTDKSKPMLINLANNFNNYLAEIKANTSTTVRGAQLQAAFPDVIFTLRKQLMKDPSKGWSPQRFCDDDECPLELQFPGAGPILRRTQDGSVVQEDYLWARNFATKFTSIISRGTSQFNEQIFVASLSWSLSENYDVLSQRAGKSSPSQRPYQDSESKSRATAEDSASFGIQSKPQSQQPPQQQPFQQGPQQYQQPPQQPFQQPQYYGGQSYPSQQQYQQPTAPGYSPTGQYPFSPNFSGQSAGFTTPTSQYYSKPPTAKEMPGSKSNKNQ